MEKTITFRASDRMISDLDFLVEIGVFDNKSDALRVYAWRGIKAELKKLKV